MWSSLGFGWQQLPVHLQVCNAISVVQCSPIISIVMRFQENSIYTLVTCSTWTAHAQLTVTYLYILTICKLQNTRFFFCFFFKSSIFSVLLVFFMNYSSLCYFKSLCVLIAVPSTSELFLSCSELALNAKMLTETNKSTWQLTQTALFVSRDCKMYD